jgi:hypothetical protein
MENPVDDLLMINLDLHPLPSCRLPASLGSPGYDFLYEWVRTYEASVHCAHYFGG